MAEEVDKFTRLYLGKSKLIKNYLIKIGAGAEDAEDITQDTFTKAVEYMANLADINMSAWLFKVALNKYYDLCRKEKKYPRVMVDDETFVQLFIQEEDGMSALLIQEKRGEVQRVFDRISDVNKNLLLLKYDFNLSYEKIADMLEINPNNMKTYMQRARADFKKKWKENENE